MKTLLVVTLKKDDGSSFYRAAGPLSNLARKTDNFRIKHAFGPQTWADMCEVDGVFFQRPCTEEHFNLLCLAKMCGKRVWVDYDDDFTCLPRHHPIHASHRNSKKIIDQIKSIADFVTVSTEELVKTYGGTVIPNALDTDTLRFIDVPKERRKIIYWRGGGSHDMDLWNERKAIVDLIKEHRDYGFMFLGYPSAIAMEEFYDCCPDKQQVGHVERLETVAYHRFLANLRPEICIVPLLDNQFNRGKSNCSWIEATWAGAKTVAPAFPEFSKPGVFTGDLYEQVNIALHNPDINSMKYIEENLTLDVVNKQRFEILRALMS